MGFLDELTACDRAVLLTSARRVVYRDGAEIIVHGDRSRETFVVLDGAAMATLVSLEGRFVAYRTIGPGDVFGELAALTGAPRNAWVHARGSVEVGVLGADVLERVIVERPGIALALCRHLAGMVADLTERVFEHTALPVRQRLARELVRRAAANGDCAVIERLSPHAELAAFIGTHREAVTKELSALAREGLIHRDGRAVRIPSLRALESAIAGAEH
ncbi:Crp/Fnr family transcriptional regulator [Pikeienuella piscinae]|uniref:Crp/Fnr family transcriptional regulator n=1 Tax=Pikeienuella piscinae TaxID=2748098 RepID=A0A7L5BTR5_9RHOB|nr:Crp/Fnr family transcriptional regulator [Pikeienuella piscinae]QIE55520.1 Crp/Fnr family transcriptional regulator [Pikeienuella piscinae]